MPLAAAIRGVTPLGDAAETFSVSAGSARWKSPIDAGTASYLGPAFYQPQGGPIDLTAWFLDTLLARPDKTLNLLPGGKAHNRAMVRHRHLHVANADMAGRKQSVPSCLVLHLAGQKTARPGVDSETGCKSRN